MSIWGDEGGDSDKWIDFGDRSFDKIVGAWTLSSKTKADATLGVASIETSKNLTQGAKIGLAIAGMAVVIVVVLILTKRKK